MFDKYVAYSSEDFVQDDWFIKWVKTPDPACDAYWTEFLRSYPHKKEAVEQAGQVIIKLKEALFEEIEGDDAIEIWDGIQAAIERQAHVRSFKKIPWARTLAAALIIIVSGLIGWQIVTYQTSTKPDHEIFDSTDGKGLTEVANTSEGPMLVMLPDSSTVILQPKGVLRYKPNFIGAQREVLLEGEGFFDVTRNPEKPFTVYTKELSAKVLGTSFSIKAENTSEDVTVAVKTGKVFVFANRSETTENETYGIILRPNQQVAYRKGVEKLTRTLVPDPLPLIPEEGQKHLTFTNAAISDVFKALSEAYGVEVLFDEDLLSGCTITTSLTNETLFEKLDILCEAIGASYKVIDAQIVITGKKCL